LKTAFLEEKKYFAGVNKYDMIQNRYSADDIKRWLANTFQIVYEVTESCNMTCKYCGYGELYTNPDERKNQSLDLDIAKKVLDYMMELFESPLNRKHHKKISLSFYGGEPLYNMSLIKEMVNYARHKKLIHKAFYLINTWISWLQIISCC
jgi:uncharacterized protein